MLQLRTYTQLDYSRIESSGRDYDSDSSRLRQRQLTTTTTIATIAITTVLEKA
jgi:hypothetical protein